MTIDTPPEATAPLEPLVTIEAEEKTRSSGRLWKILLALVAVIGVAAAAPLISGSVSKVDTGPKLTHTIARGDLRVTVVEQGTLESSSNTEIKCKVRGTSTVLEVVETGTEVKPGDVLVRLDTSTIEDNINQQKIVYQRALATHTQSETNVSVAAISITEYLEGTYRSEMQTLEKDLAIAESNLRTAKNMQEYSQRMFRKGYSSELEVEGLEFSLKQAELELDLMKTEIDVLERFTKEKQLETLRSTLKSAEATLASDKAALDLEKARLDREEQQLENCVIVADTSGMVIYPSAAQWKETPDIEEGATVREDQVLLLIPDLTQMQVKVGIHESKIDRLSVGMPARVRLLEEVLDGEVSSVASVTRPAGWWTGNVVKYDTIVELAPNGGVKLKPGMSVEVEIILAEHQDVLTIPVAAVVNQDQQYFCWVKTAEGPQKRQLDLGDSNDQFIVINGGVAEGDEVIINPRAHIEEARVAALKPTGEPESDDRAASSPASAIDSEGLPSPGEAADSESSKGGDAKPSAETSGQKLLQLSDKNGDGVLTKDEYDDEHKQYFDLTDSNQDGQVDAQELDAFIKRMQAAGERT